MRTIRPVRLVFVALAGMLFVGLGGSALAQTGTVPWTGQGTDSVDQCEPGEDPIFHWVFTTGGNDTVTSAVLTLKGSNFPMSQSGQGSWSVDTPSIDPADIGEGEAFVTFTGSLGAGNANLVISHGCFEEGPTYPPTTQPAAVAAAGEQGGGGPGSGVLGASEGAAGAALAFTGAELTLLVAAFGILLAGGAVAVIAARRRSRPQTG
jgi:hypothetical protein